MTAQEKKIIKSAMLWFIAQRNWHENYRDVEYQFVLRSISALRDACEAYATRKKRTTDAQNSG